MTKLAARHVIMEILQAEGVRFIFGNPGSTETPFLDALVQYPNMEYVLGLHESALVAMADGYARGTGQPAAVSIHAAAGTANALGSIYNAMRDRTPLVILAGQQNKRLLAQDPPLAGDTVAMVGSVVKWAWELSNAAELPLLLRRAFNLARRPPRGPVFLSFPKDILDDEINFSTVGYHPSADLVATAPLEEVDRAAGLIAKAENPMIIAGPGLSYQSAWKPLAKVAELCGAPIYASPVGFPARHPQVCGLLGWVLQGLRKVIASSDVVLVAGHRMLLDDPLNPLIRPEVSIVQFDDDMAEVDRNAAATVGVVGELNSSLSALGRSLNDQLRGREAVCEKRKERTLALAETVRNHAESALRGRWDGVPIAPARVIAELDEVLPDDAIIVDEAVRSSGYVKQHFRWAGPSRYFYYDGGYLGWGIGMAVGTQMALPDRRVAAVVGDGAALFGIHGLWTAARRNLPVVIIVLDNRSYGAVVAALVDYKGEAVRRGVYPGCDLTGIDLLGLASGFGVQGRSVSRPEELKPAFQWAFEIGKPVLVHVPVDRSDLGPGHPGRPN